MLLFEYKYSLFCFQSLIYFTGMGYMSIVVLPGSIVHSDQWTSYREIQQRLALEHKTVNHSLHYVDPHTGVHTQSIESYWANKKYSIKVMKGCLRDHLPSYLQEFMWRERNRDNTFENMCILLAHLQQNPL